MLKLLKGTVKIRKRLEQLRQLIRDENISYGELAELQSLAKYIDASDVELREAAGIPELPCQHDDIFYRKLLQIDGVPHYTVQCNDCSQFGTILLVEDENKFDLTEMDIAELEGNH